MMDQPQPGLNAPMHSQPSTDDYRQLIESFAQAVWEANAGGQIVDDSPSWRAYTGQTTAQWLGEGWTNAVHPHQRQAVLAQWRQAVQNQQPVQAEYQLQHAQGGWRWTSVRATPVFEPDGSVRKWIGLNVDISDRKRAEEAQRESDRFVQGLVRSLPLVIYLFDLAQRRNRYLSPQVIDLFGYTPEQMQAANIDLVDTFFHPDDWPRLVAHFEHILAQQQDGVFPLEYRIKHPQRGWVWVESRDTVYARDAQGQPTLLLGTAEDITERKSNAQAVVESEKRLRLAIEAAQLATWEWDLITDQVYWNEQHFRLFGMVPQREPVKSETFVQHIHPEDRLHIAYLLTNAIDKQSLFDAEFRVIRDDGAIRWMSGYGHVTDKAGNQPLRMSGVMFDITDWKEAQQALLEADRRKDEFLAMLAHELRNPMATVRNGLNILGLTSEPDDTTRQTLAATTVAMMNRQVDHLVRMVDDLLDVSRISRGKIELKRERLDLGSLLDGAVEAIRPQYETHHKGLHLASLPTSLLVDGDATRLSQIITNLLTNGLRYTGEGGQVWVRLRAENGAAVLRVLDNGIGLSTDQRQMIFDLFVQVDNSLARSQGGLGVGLTLSQRLIELHGGRIEVHSAGLGQGSEFVVSLPLLEEPAPEKTMSTTSASGQTRPRILVIDDNADVALTLSMLLKLKGYDVQSRHSGREGIQAAEAWHPGVIVCDISMPGMDGYHTARLIREQPWGSAVYLVALTGYSQAEAKERALEAGFDAHLVKPVDLEALLGLLM